jgi:hypothetical protein
MNEYLRKDTSVEPNQNLRDIESSEKAEERAVGSDPDSRGGAPLAAAEPRPVIAVNSAKTDDMATGVASTSATAVGAAGAAVARAPEEEKVALFAANESKDLRARWDSIQVGFVDEPRKAVQAADALVSDAIKRLSEIFANERQALEHQWDRNENVSTEDLRLSLRRYRSFFGRLLNI